MEKPKIMGKAEEFRNFARAHFERDEMFHQTRIEIAANKLKEIAGTNKGSRFAHALLSEIEDDFFKHFIEPEDIGLTWELWRELCQEYGYEGLTERHIKELKDLLRDDCDPEKLEEEKRRANVEPCTIDDADTDLRMGNVTLEEMGFTPEQWQQLCKKLEYFSVYEFYCVPEIFGNPVFTFSAEIEVSGSNEYELVWHCTGKTVDKDGDMYPLLQITVFLVKTGSGERQYLGVKEVLMNDDEDMPLGLKSAKIITQHFADVAANIIKTRSFVADTFN